MYDTGKNIWFTSLSAIIPAIFTFVFWVFVARISGGQALGLASAIASFSIILATVNGLDIYIGMKRALGRSVHTGDNKLFSTYIMTATSIVFLVTVLSGFILSSGDLRILSAIGIEPQYLPLIVTLILAQVLQNLFMEALVSARESKKLVIPFIIATMMRFPLLIILTSFSVSSDMSTIIAYSSTIFITSGFFIIYVFKLFRIHEYINIVFFKNFVTYAKELIRSSSASWVPTMLNVFGYQLGVIVVFSSQGAQQAGTLYLIMGIFFIILFLVKSANRVIHPLIGNVEDQKERARLVSYSIKMGFIFTVPLSVVVLFFSERILSLVGAEFQNGSFALSIMMINIPLVIVSESIYFLQYGMGELRSVLLLGLLGNVPRVLLYLLLSDSLGITGAAISYLVGSILQIIYAFVIARKEKIHVPYTRTFAPIIAVPLVIAIACWTFNIDFLLSIAAIILLSGLLYIMLNLITDREIKSVIFALLPAPKATKAYGLTSAIIHKINRFS
jgi:O-antigen/teichoic acid export membrane protein